MNSFEEIKQAVEDRKVVHWLSNAYAVEVDGLGQMSIRFNGDHASYSTMIRENSPAYDPKDFYVGEDFWEQEQADDERDNT